MDTTKMEMQIDDDAEPRQRWKEYLSSFVDNGSKESHRYYLSRKTVLEMLRDRGYSLPDSEIEMSLNQFRGIHGQSPDTSRLGISPSHESNPSNKITDLLVNVTKHKMMPKHRLLTNEEKEQLLKKYSVDEKQLPRIQVDDAIVRYYAFEKGQVLEVTNNSEITGSYVSYRCVW